MLVQLMKHLQIIIWLLLTFNLTLFCSTIISTVYHITPTAAVAVEDIVPTAATSPISETTIKSARASTVTSSSSSYSTPSTSSINYNKRLQLLQQKYLPYYQNFPYSPHMATEFMETLENSNQQAVPMDQRQQKHQIEYTSHILTHKVMTTNRGSNRSGTTSHKDNNEHNNNIVDINYNSLNRHRNRLHTTNDGKHHSSQLSGGSVGDGGSHEEGFPKSPQPYFDLTMPRNITARAGQIAAINCRVENLGDKSVSWIRKRDLHILTAGILTYTSDERFKVTRTTDRKQWTLYIKYAQPRDSGIYECQVNTEPKMSMAFRLNVIVTPPDAKATISGPADLYVKIGSAITLTCHIKQPSSAHDIGPIHWYRGPYILTPFVVHPNEAAIDMQRISMESKLGDKLQSRLRISNAQLADSGNYTCMPTTAEAASVMVNVLNDESPAAMQKSSASATGLLLQQKCKYFNPRITTIIISLIFLLILNQTNRQLWQIKHFYYQHYTHQQEDYHRHHHHHPHHHHHHHYYQQNRRISATLTLHSPSPSSLSS